jgi:hypothetical protein
MYQRILIVLEGRGTDEAVLAHARALAVQTGAQVTLLRVIAVADDGGGGLGKQFQLEVGSSGCSAAPRTTTCCAGRRCPPCSSTMGAVRRRSSAPPLRPIR